MLHFRFARRIGYDGAMSNPKDILSSEEYHNYRWVRLSIWVFVIGGWVVLFGGVRFFLGTLAGMDMGRRRELPPGLGILLSW